MRSIESLRTSQLEIARPATGRVAETFLEQVREIGERVLGYEILDVVPIEETDSETGEQIVRQKNITKPRLEVYGLHEVKYYHVLSRAFEHMNFRPKHMWALGRIEKAPLQGSRSRTRALMTNVFDRVRSDMDLGEAFASIGNDHAIDDQHNIPVRFSGVVALPDAMRGQEGRELGIMLDAAHPSTEMLLEQTEFCLKSLLGMSLQYMPDTIPDQTVHFCRLPDGVSSEKKRDFLKQINRILPETGFALGPVTTSA